MVPQKRRYYVTLVHYGDLAVTRRAVRALQDGERVPDGVAVVNHGPGPVELAGVAVLQPQGNGGYGAGLNVGLGFWYGQGARGNDIVVAMNNDVRVQRHTLRRLSEWWADQPALVLTGARGGMAYPWHGRSVLGEGGRQGLGVPYIHGSFMAAPLELWMRLRGMPEDFFLYWEDVLFSWQVHQAGYALAVVPKLGVDHDDARTASGEQHYYLVRNGALFWEKRGPWWARPGWWLANRARLGWHRYVSKKRIVEQALRDAVHGKTGKRDDE